MTSLLHSDLTSTGALLVSADGALLPLTSTQLSGELAGGVARIVLRQTFENPSDEPLQVTYTLPLPADGAVSGFRFRLGEVLVSGRVEAREAARAAFEEAVLEGKTAALLEQERTSLFTQALGNVPPRATVGCEVCIDHPLLWLPEGAWEWRFPTVVAPRYLGAAGRVADAQQVTVAIAEAPLKVTTSLELRVRDALSVGARPKSPSHALSTASEANETVIRLADGQGASLDRDVVVRVPVAGSTVKTALSGAAVPEGALRGRAFGLLTVVPPSVESKHRSVPRDVIVLLDTSGSMGGAPLRQAQRLTVALIDSLSEGDQLELVEFSSAPRRWKAKPVKADAAARQEAQRWVMALRASGGTEMRAGILAALETLRAESLRQVVLITDGLIGFEAEVLQAIGTRLPAGSRVHTIGVGNGVNRSLTQPAARAGRGVELIIGLDEDVEPAVARLLARTAEPLFTNVSIEGSAVVRAPQLPADCFAASPSLIPLELRPEGGTVVLRAHTADGAHVETLTLPPLSAQSDFVARALFGRASVEALELEIAIHGPSAARDSQVERLGLDFQLSTRRTSWVAVSDRVTVDPRAPKRRVEMPHELAAGLSAEGVGLGGLSPRTMTAAFPQRARGGIVATVGGALKDVLKKRSAEPMAPAGAPRPPAAPSPKSEAPSERASRGAVFEASADAEGLRRQRHGGPGGAPTATTLRGRVRRAGQRVVVEVDVVAARTWKTPATLEVELADGRRVTLEVVPGLTTNDGVLSPGVTLTVVAALPAGWAAEALWAGVPVTARLDNAGEQMVVLLEVQ